MIKEQQLYWLKVTLLNGLFNQLSLIILSLDLCSFIVVTFHTLTYKFMLEWNINVQIDIVKLNSKKVHADDSKRICDYPTIQDIIGENISSTNAGRSMVYSIARGMDEESNECDWMKGVKFSKFEFPLFQYKFISAKYTSKVTDDMLHVMGGDGLKRQFELERYLRDSKIG